MNAETVSRRDAHFPGRAPIDSYGNGGFRFADMSHRGSILCLPSGIRGWKALADDGVPDLESLAPVIAEATAIDLLLIGMGADIRALPKPVAAALRAAGIRFEVMATGTAIRTYNILLDENRMVAAALVAV